MSAGPTSSTTAYSSATPVSAAAIRSRHQTSTPMATWSNTETGSLRDLSSAYSGSAQVRPHSRHPSDCRPKRRCLIPTQSTAGSESVCAYPARAWTRRFGGVLLRWVQSPSKEPSMNEDFHALLAQLHVGNQTTCQSCVFLEDLGNGVSGRCRRHAPTPQRQADFQEHQVSWPVVEKHLDWCWEHRPSRASSRHS